MVLCIQASRYLESLGDIGVTVADARFMKPLDEELITELAQNHEAVIMIEVCWHQVMPFGLSSVASLLRGQGSCDAMLCCV